MKTLALIPHYRHLSTLPAVIAALRARGLPVLVVDDGSGSEYRDALAQLAGRQVEILFKTPNGGKGSAVKYGLAAAAERGYSHVLQIDADAQHCFDDIEKLLAVSCNNPEAVVCGSPVYGRDAPKARLYGRKITDFWNVIHTWSFAVKDGMCGFRVYPLAAVNRVITEETVGDAMDFDNEILVRLVWRKVPLLWVDTPVHYQAGGVSHFRGWRDNWLISKMHTRLFFGMLAHRLGWRR